MLSRERLPLRTHLVGLLLALTLCGYSATADEGQSLFVEGYTGAVSYAPGDKLTLHLSSSMPNVAIEITRIGAAPETVWRSNADDCRPHPVPLDASSFGCRWPAAVTLEIPASWRSGYYHVSLRVQDNGGAFIRRNLRRAEGSCYFVLRPQRPGNSSKVLLQLATHTYNAYNNWGGFSLYGYHGRGGTRL